MHERRVRRWNRCGEVRSPSGLLLTRSTLQSSRVPARGVRRMQDGGPAARCGRMTMLLSAEGRQTPALPADPGLSGGVGPGRRPALGPHIGRWPMLDCAAPTTPAQLPRTQAVPSLMHRWSTDRIRRSAPCNRGPASLPGRLRRTTPLAYLDVVRDEPDGDRWMHRPVGAVMNELRPGRGRQSRNHEP